jgi:diguanylate cyclase (GGDEF)-like protein
VKIKNRVLLTLLVTGLLSLGATWLVLSRYEEGQAHEHLIASATAITEALVIPCAIAVAEQEIENLDNFVGALATEASPLKDLEYVAVLDSEGRVMAHTNPVEYAQRLEATFYQQAVDSEVATHRFYRPVGRADGTVLEVASPIATGIRWGTLVVALSADRELAEVRAMGLRLLLLLGLLFFVPVVAIYAILSHSLIAPARELTEAAERAAQLEFHHLPEERFPGELQSLVKAFSWMETEIEQHTERLNQTIARRTAELKEALAKVEALARTDGLTGLANFRHFKETLQREMHLARRARSELSLLMIDVDHFKHYNDRNGHPAGDQVLRDLADILQSSVRSTDIVARYGGEEFVVVLVGTELSQAEGVAQKIRHRVEEHAFAFGAEQPLGRVSVSVGVADFPACASSYETLVASADQALYRAKSEGRNRVSLAGPPSDKQTI